MAEVDAGAVAPVVPVAPASTDAPAPESTAEQVVETPEQPETPDEPRLTQSEVNKIVAKRVAQAERNAAKVARAEARAEYAERQLLERTQVQQPQPQAGEPKQSDFTDYEEYLLARAEWRFDQKQAKRTQDTDAQRQERESHDAMSARAEKARSALSKAAAKYDDFEEVITGNYPCTEAMTAYIAEAATDGGELAYHLGTHVDEAKRIANLPPAKQIVELHILESKLNAAPAPTKVPAPIVPNAGRASVEKRLEDAQTQEEFNAIRRRQIAARKGAWK